MALQTEKRFLRLRIRYLRQEQPRLGILNWRFRWRDQLNSSLMLRSNAYRGDDSRSDLMSGKTTRDRIAGLRPTDRSGEQTGAIPGRKAVAAFPHSSWPSPNVARASELLRRQLSSSATQIDSSRPDSLSTGLCMNAVECAGSGQRERSSVPRPAEVVDTASAAAPALQV